MCTIFQTEYINKGIEQQRDFRSTKFLQQGKHFIQMAYFAEKCNGVFKFNKFYFLLIFRVAQRSILVTVRVLNEL